IVSWENLTMKPVSNTGNSVCAAISPDGKHVVHAEKKDGLQALVVTGVIASDPSDIVPAAAVDYRGITFSPDGSYIYVVRSEAESDVPILYRIAWPGGALRKIREGVDGPIAFHPQGERFTFVRVNRALSEYSLVVADTNGDREETITTRRDGNTFSKYGP